jgi:hypothetical protein
MLRDKYRLRVSENRVLRIIFAPKLDEVTWDRRMHNVERYVYSSPVIIWVTKSRRMRLVGQRGETGVYRVFVGKKCGKETT